MYEASHRVFFPHEIYEKSYDFKRFHGSLESCERLGMKFAEGCRNQFWRETVGTWNEFSANIRNSWNEKINIFLQLPSARKFASQSQIRHANLQRVGCANWCNSSSVAFFGYNLIYKWLPFQVPFMKVFRNATRHASIPSESRPTRRSNLLTLFPNLHRPSPAFVLFSTESRLKASD